MPIATPHAVLFVRGDADGGREDLPQGEALEACVVLAEDTNQAMAGAGTALTREGRGDAVLIGAMSLAQIEGLVQKMRSFARQERGG